MKAPNAVVIS